MLHSTLLVMNPPKLCFATCFVKVDYHPSFKKMLMKIDKCTIHVSFDSSKPLTYVHVFAFLYLIVATE